MSPRLAIAASALIACSAPPPAARTTVEPPAAITTCYAGTVTGMGQTSRTVARRTVDPKASQIVEDVSHDVGGKARTFHVVLAVTGEHFTMTEASNAFTGEGTLAGEPWRWTSWTSTSKLPNTDIVVESDDEIADGKLRAKKQIKQAGKVVATTVEELAPFDCALWDKAVADVAAPPVGDAACTQACRNFASLRFWAQHTRSAETEADLESRLSAGMPACVTECRDAGNAKQTACMAAAKTVDDLTACE